MSESEKPTHPGPGEFVKQLKLSSILVCGLAALFLVGGFNAGELSKFKPRFEKVAAPLLLLTPSSIPNASIKFTETHGFKDTSPFWSNPGQSPAEYIQYEASYATVFTGAAVLSDALGTTTFTVSEPELRPLDFAFVDSQGGYGVVSFYETIRDLDALRVSIRNSPMKSDSDLHEALDEMDSSLREMGVVEHKDVIPGGTGGIHQYTEYPDAKGDEWLELRNIRSNFEETFFNHTDTTHSWDAGEEDRPNLGDQITSKDAKVKAAIDKIENDFSTVPCEITSPFFSGLLLRRPDHSLVILDTDANEIDLDSLTKQLQKLSMEAGVTAPTPALLMDAFAYRVRNGKIHVPVLDVDVNLIFGALTLLVLILAELCSMYDSIAQIAFQTESGTTNTEAFMLTDPLPSHGRFDGAILRTVRGAYALFLLLVFWSLPGLCLIAALYPWSPLRTSTMLTALASFFLSGSLTAFLSSRHLLRIAPVPDSASRLCQVAVRRTVATLGRAIKRIRPRRSKAHLGPAVQPSASSQDGQEDRRTESN